MISLSFASGALICSLIALLLSVSVSYRIRRSHRHRTLEKQLHEAQDELVELLDRFEKVQLQIKKLYGRQATRDSRAKAQAQPNGEETDDDWKARMAREYALGRRTIG